MRPTFQVAWFMQYIHVMLASSQNIFELTNYLIIINFKKNKS